jgi:Protein of unknown function (DUF3054)
MHGHAEHGGTPAPPPPAPATPGPGTPRPGTPRPRHPRALAPQAPGARYGIPVRPAPTVAAAAVVAAAALDCCGVLAFVIIGRHTHHDGDSLAGIWHTAWPFLCGLAAGLASMRFWRRPLAIVPTGVAAWLGAAVAGMLIRVFAGQGTAAAFVLVTLAFLALFLLGWRMCWRLGRRLAATGAVPDG